MRKLLSLLMLACYMLPYGIARADEAYTKYLFLYFPSNSDENIYYALSDNGFDYTPFNNGQCIVAADSVSIMGGLRDPHILRAHDGWYYMVATDMRSALGWASNRGMVLMKSQDLIHWEHSTVHFPTKYEGTNFANVTRVWAPETIYDAVAGKYMVYYSLLTDDGTISYDKVYYNYVNDDFTDLIGEPTYFYDRGSATIDMDIVYNPKDNLYHAFYKNEGSGGICKVTASSLTPASGQPDGSQWSSPSGTLQQTNVAVEGAGVFQLIDSDTWVLMYDCYGSGYYQFCTSTDLETFTFKQNTYTSGAFTPRHGTVIPVTDAEIARMNKALGNSLEDREEAVKDASLDNPMTVNYIVNGEMNSGTIGWLSTTGASNQQTATNQNDDFEVPFLENWNSSAFTGKIYQTVSGIPNGTYSLNIAAFVNTLGDGTQQYVYANDEKVYLTKATPTNYQIVFYVTDNVLEVGIWQTAAVANWIGIDNVRLTYYGAGENVLAVQSLLVEQQNAAVAATLIEEIAIARSLGVDVTEAQALLAREGLTAEEVTLAVQELKVAEYQTVMTNYTDDRTSLLGQWTTVNQTTRNGQHYNGTNESTYWEQDSGWTGTSWNMSMTQTLTLPVGGYVLKCACRSASGGVVATMSAQGKSVSFPAKGDTGYGIDTSGTANFSANGQYANNGEGRGWEWRYLPFALYAPTDVTIRLSASVENATHQWASMTSLSILRKDITILPGDIDGNGKVESSDLPALVALLLTNADVDEINDVNNDQRLSLADVTALADIIINSSDN